MHAAVLKTKNALRHPLTLGGVLVGSGIAFTVAPGSLGDFMALAGAVFALNVIIGNYRLREMTAGHLAALGIVSVLVLLSLSLPGAKVHDRSMRFLLLAPGVIMACHALAKQLVDIRRETVTAIAAAVICLGVTVQFIGFKLYKPATYHGFYENPHHLGLFASLVLPLMGYVMLRLNGWRRVLVVPWMTAAFFLLLESGSRVSWIVFFATIPFVSFLFLRRKQFVSLLFGACALTALSAWLAGFSSIGARITDFFVNFSSEDRLQMWPATLEFMKQNTASEWLFGRGIGSFRLSFGEHFANVELLRKHAFPHNAVLQLLFENGLAGLLLVFGGFGSLMWILLRASRRLQDPGDRYMAMTLFALLCIDAGHCLLTKSIYSKYIVYSLSLVVGVSLVIIEKARASLADPQASQTAYPHGSDVRT